jgi:general secretion pathway protein K
MMLPDKTRHPRSAPVRAQRGVALLIVLWVIALLTVMALGMTTARRTEGALTQNQLDGARFRAAADAAIVLTALNLISTPLMPPVEGDTDVWIPDGSGRAIEVDGQRLEVRLYNEQSRLNLNTASREQLLALIEVALGQASAEAEAADTDPALADALADAIIDWRDEDDLTQLNGAEDGDYESAGLPYGARDAPFQTVEELREVLGMTRELYQRLAPDLTVYSENDRVDTQFASAAVLAAVEDLTLEDAQLLIEERGLSQVPDAVQAAPVNRGGPLYRLRVAYLSADAGRRSMEALIRVEAGGEPPFAVLWRRFGMLDEPAAADDSDTI